MLSEISQSEKDKYHMISLICGIQNRNRLIDTVVRGEGLQEWVKKVKGLSKKTKPKQNLIDSDNRMVITRGKGVVREVEQGKRGDKW